MIINIIHLENNPHYPHREEREKSVIEQMNMEGCQYKFWPGIVANPRKTGINRAHRQIVQWAKDTNQQSVIIAEDDLLWYDKGAWKYYLDKMPEDYDIYLSSYYSGKANENNIIQSFSGLTLYSVHSRYFDKYLAIPEHMHIDTGISLIGGKFVVCDKFVTKQMKSFSEQRGRIADDSGRHKGKPIYGQ
jgi:hypothetical protein